MVAKRHLDAPPPHRAGKVEAVFWQAMKVADAVLTKAHNPANSGSEHALFLPSPGRIFEIDETDRG